MLLYMGSGAALAAYRRERRVRQLAECAEACGALFQLDRDRPEAGREDRARLALALMSARDCLALCGLTGSLLARQSALAPFALPACAEACRRCAEACDALSPDEVSAECARLCRRAEGLCSDSAEAQVA